MGPLRIGENGPKHTCSGLCPQLGEMLDKLSKAIWGSSRSMPQQSQAELREWPGVPGMPGLLPEPFLESFRHLLDHVLSFVFEVQNIIFSKRPNSVTSREGFLENALTTPRALFEPFLEGRTFQT